MNKTLLIVDDARILREQIRNAACSADWEVVAEATNGQEAVERYAEFHPTAVTLDLVMPKFDGLHALRNIMIIDPDAKVVIVSALGQKSILKEAIQLGAADFVVKPFDPTCLVHMLARFLSTELAPN